MARLILQTDVITMKIWSSDTSSELQACVTTLDFVIDPTTYNAGVYDSALVALYDGVIAATYKACLSDSVRYNGVQLTYRNVRPLPLTEYSNGNAGAGTGGVGLAPTQVRGLTKKLTALAGRQYRGRIFFPFVSAADVGITGLPAGAYTGAMSAFITAGYPVAGASFTSAGGVVKLLPVLWNRQHSTTTPITAFQYEQFFGTQKRSGSLGRPNSSPIFA